MTKGSSHKEKKEEEDFLPETMFCLFHVTTFNQNEKNEGKTKFSLLKVLLCSPSVNLNLGLVKRSQVNIDHSHHFQVVYRNRCLSVRSEF